MGFARVGAFALTLAAFAAVSAAGLQDDPDVAPVMTATALVLAVLGLPPPCAWCC